MGKCISNICTDIMLYVFSMYGRIYFKYMYIYMETFMKYMYRYIFNIWYNIFYIYVNLYGDIPEIYVQIHVWPPGGAGSIG